MKNKESGHAPWFLALETGKGACWSSGMGLLRVTSNLVTPSNLHQTKQHVGQYYVRAHLVLKQPTGDFRFTRLTTAQIRGKPLPSPIQYTLHLFARVSSKWLFVSGLLKGSPKIAKVRTLATLRGYNFALRPPMGTRYKAKLQLSLRAFQRCVARHLHARKSGRFLTFCGQESKWQSNSRPFFLP